jgi:hypothetical protein
LVPASSGAGCVPNQFGMDQTINPMVKSRYVMVADPIVALFHQTHISDLFNIAIEPYCPSLIGAN